MGWAKESWTFGPEERIPLRINFRYFPRDGVCLSELLKKPMYHLGSQDGP